jgi:hypothetical protein
LKACRFILSAIAVLVFFSCGDDNENDRAALTPGMTQQSPRMEWHPPEVTDGWITLPGSMAPAEAVREDARRHERPAQEIIRDTIEGIAVRLPGQIRIPDETRAPLNRDILEQAIFSINYTSDIRIVSIGFENDIFNNTDYYYTNGIRFSYISPVFASSPFAAAMIPYRRASLSYHGMNAIQNMYTPTNPDTTVILEGDRPFSAYLIFGHFKNTLDHQRHYRIFTELQAGLIGPGSLGGFIQDQIHDIPPVGWQNQVQNDLVLNYSVLLEKGLFNRRHFDLNIYTGGQVGTLYTNAGGGIRLRAGWMDPYFSMPAASLRSNKAGKQAENWQFGIFATASAKAVGYDATLQGGLFNKSSSYTIPPEDIQRLTFQSSAGIFASYYGWGLLLEQHYITPEFRDALHHRWGEISMSYSF